MSCYLHLHTQTYVFTLRFLEFSCSYEELHNGTALNSIFSYINAERDLKVINYF